MSNNPAENVRFLVACINHNTNGKPNFELVAQELGIVSKGAASKRYERLLKSCGVSPSGKPLAATTAAADPVDGDEEPAKPAGKKRKIPVASTVSKAPAVKKIKAAPRGKRANTKVKEEEVEDEDVKAKSESESSLSDAPEDSH
ncbi:hypothetical protein V2A60_006643 [Cordyceps javanica]|uniref:Myb-like DNA-binding domain-containing protein n=1 Tax=Cordyceps javanica TaxID=43265 RepID=A0A545V7D1_9HYPO|nr:hypothetical protein IF1G_03357 [Cordyceps javanica]TQW09205.1 hypothetical protein IF2G_03636 [Cordyceps javanica]